MQQKKLTSIFSLVDDECALASENDVSLFDGAALLEPEQFASDGARQIAFHHDLRVLYLPVVARNQGLGLERTNSNQ